MLSLVCPIFRLENIIRPRLLSSFTLLLLTFCLYLMRTFIFTVNPHQSHLNALHLIVSAQPFCHVWGQPWFLGMGMGPPLQGHPLAHLAQHLLPAHTLSLSWTFWNPSNQPQALALRCGGPQRPVTQSQCRQRPAAGPAMSGQGHAAGHFSERHVACASGRG